MSKELRKAKRELRAEGHSRAAARRLVNQDEREDVVVYKKGGKLPSNNKKKHRGKTSHGRHSGY